MTKIRYILASLICVLLFSAMVFFFFLYSNHLQVDLRKTACETLSELLEQQKNNLASRVSADENSIKNLAKIVPHLPKDQAERLRIISTLTEDTNFDYLILSDTRGVAISSSHVSLNIVDRSYFKAAMEGKTVLQGPRMSSLNNSTIIPLASPIWENGQITGVIVAAYSIEALNDLILPSYNGQAFAYITDSAGSIIYRSPEQDPLFQRNNLLSVFQNVDFLSNDTYDDIERKLRLQESGHTTFRLDGDTRLMHFTPLGINDWTLFIAVPESVITTQRDSIFKSTATLIATAALLLALLSLYALFLQRKRIKEKRNHMADLESAAYFDALTGLPNMNKFKLDAVDYLQAHPDEPLVVMKLDIQNFKVINEMFGFGVGDRIICRLANCVNTMRQTFSTPSVFARVNADEFIFLAILTDEMAHFSPESEDLPAQIAKEFARILGSHKITLRYGRYIFHSSECDVQGMIEHVTLAHSMAKSEKDTIVFDYNEQLRERTLQEARLENKMENALQNREFHVYLQAKYDLQQETVVGAEALVRWLEPDGTLISPRDFIPLFERNGFIVKLDMYVFESVCALMHDYIVAGGAPIPVSINFSHMHLRRPDFVSDLAAMADRYDIPKQFLEIELTESIIFNHDDILEDLLLSLHDTGFSLSMDDFGTGFSSLGLLKNLPLDVIKIDKTFFDLGPHDQRTRLVVESIMEMAKKLHIATVAEGVERTEQIDFLRQVGCDIAQGFFYARPIPAVEFFASLTAQNNCKSADRAASPVNPPTSLPLLSACSAPPPTTSYRLSQSAMRDALSARYGEAEACALLHSGGQLAGQRLAHQLPVQSLPLSDIMAYLVDYFEQLGLGRMQCLTDPVDSTVITLLLQEEAGSTPLPYQGHNICQYTEGLLSAFLTTYMNEPYTVEERACQANGDAQCCFYVSLQKAD